MNSTISVVVMAFNEAESLETVVNEIDTVLTGLKKPYEIIVIDDGSIDSTGDIAKRLAKEKESMRVIRHNTNKGLGGVYRTGFDNAKGDFITFFPADGQFPASIIEEFLYLMDNMDMVLGYIPDRKSAILAKSLSGLERTLFRLLFGPMPKFQGVLMFRRTLLGRLELKSSGRGWTILMELIIRAKRAGCRMRSVPTKFRPRMRGKSKVNNLLSIWSNLRQAIALRKYL